MSVISTMEATPNRVGIVYRFLDAQSGPMKQEDLLAFLSPATLQKRGVEVGDEKEIVSVVAPRVLDECKALGLVESGPDEGTLQVPPTLRGLNQVALRSLLEQRLTDPDAAAGCGQEKVPHALAWFLSQSPARPLAVRENQAKVIEAETGGRTLDLTSVARFQQMSYWVQYLGLGWQIPTQATGVEMVIDPTDAMAPHLEAILAGKGEVPVRNAIEALGRRLPVIETGAARDEVEDWLPDVKRREPNDLSPSTSLALLRLQLRGLISLEQRSDAPVVMRLLAWPRTRQVSHLAWIQTPVGR